MSEMNSQQLKDYIKTVLELEGALYKHNKFVDEYRSYRDNHKPPQPDPERPTLIALPPRNFPAQPEFNECISLLGIVSLVIGGIGILVQLLSGLLEFSGLWFIAIGVFGGAIAGIHFDKRTKIHKEQVRQWEIACDSVRRQNETEKQRIAKKHEEQIKYYESHALLEHNRATSDQIKQFDNVKHHLESSLSKLYSQDIIYSKYRNFVAVATIYEYFDSGRCTELEGANGAYNMYENELRSNIIIASLSEIVSDLNQIKAGQYALYEQIERSNQEVTRMLANIYNAQTLTSYYAKAAAVAASADRYIVGMAW